MVLERSEEGPPQPRTPEEAIQRRYETGIARTVEDLQDQSPRLKRIPPRDSDESSGGVGGEKEKFTVPEIVKRYKQEKDQTIESSCHSWSRPRINMIRISPKDEDVEDKHQPKTPEVEERLLPQPSTPKPPEDGRVSSQKIFEDIHEQ